MSKREVQSNNIDKELSDITSQLKQLEIAYKSDRSKLETRQRSLLIKKKENPFKIGQKVRITNTYSGDYGRNSKGRVGIVTEVKKVQVTIRATDGYYYTRSYKNLELVD
jgi:hypothetical protein